MQAIHSDKVKKVPTIVVVGAGAGGLPLVCQLSRKLVRRGLARVVLIDENVNHIWKPRFHELASGVLDESVDFVNLPVQAKLLGYEFECGRAVNIDVKRKSLEIQGVNDECGNTIWPKRNQNYDYLVLAVGSRTNDYGIDGVHESCYLLDSADNALVLRSRLMNMILAAGKHRTLARIAIVGGGAAGIELAAEISRMMDSVGNRGREEGASAFRLSIIEGGASLLGAKNTELGSKVEQYLDSIGVEIHKDFPVSKVSPNHVISANGDVVEADLVIWTAGIIAPSWLSRIKGLATTPIHQLIVDEELRCHGSKDVYAIGDCASIYSANRDQKIPPRAQAAKQMADYLAHRLSAEIRGIKKDTAFKYKDHGMLIGLSHFSSAGGTPPGKSPTQNACRRADRQVDVQLYLLVTSSIRSRMEKRIPSLFVAAPDCH